LVFLDETWTSTNMAPRYGRGFKGQRVEGFAPHGHWTTTTFIAALRHDRITAPCFFDGPINGAAFKAPPRPAGLRWIEQALAPVLQKGDVVILDNLSSHKVAGVKAIEARDAKLVYLLPYSPDLNPIEQVFAKLKHHLPRLRRAHTRGSARGQRHDPQQVHTRRMPKLLK
jgi:transposase